MSLNRKNGDVDIDYLVNDDTLDMKSLKSKDLLVIGERHLDTDDENGIRRLINEYKPTYVIVEALADYKLFNRTAKQTKLNLPVKEHHYEDFTKHWIEFSMEFNIPFIGMEYVTKELGGLSYVESFKIREAHFISVIEQYRRNVFGNSNKVIAICGDTHLRTIKTLELGPVSPLYVKYNNKKDSIVIRTPVGEIH